MTTRTLAPRTPSQHRYGAAAPARLLCPPEGRTIDHLIDAGVLRYQVSGSPGGEPVVFINSLGTDQRLWGPLHALTTHYRVVTYDARGQAGTSAPPAPYTIADLGTDVVMLLDRLELRHVHVVGISLGGLAALWLGIHRADRVRSLLLANTAARIGSAEGWQERIDAVHARGMTRLATDVMERFFSDGFRKRNPDTVATFAHRFASHDAEGYVGQCAALRDTDLGPDVGRCEVPTSVVALGVSTPRPRPSKHAGCTSTSQVPNYAPSNLLAFHLDVLEDTGLISRQVSQGDRRRGYVTLDDDALTEVHPVLRLAAAGDGPVLFVCSRNSARSQLAAALWAARTGHEALSAGRDPAPRVHRHAVEVARRHGLDLEGSRPRGYEEVAGSPELVVSVCDRAREAGLPFGAPLLHWSVPSPSHGGIGEFERAYAQLSRRIDRLAEAVAA